MRKEDFDQQMKRHQVLKEYNKAYRLCLDHINDAELGAEAYEAGKNLVRQFGPLVMDENGRKKELTVTISLELEWIIDAAISLGYKTLERENISVGLLSSVNGIAIGSFLSKQKFGIRKNKDNSYTLLFVSGAFSSDYKLINRLCTDILERMHNK